jgi:hypothetical protein
MAPPAKREIGVRIPGWVTGHNNDNTTPVKAGDDPRPHLDNVLPMPRESLVERNEADASSASEGSARTSGG